MSKATSLVALIVGVIILSCNSKMELKIYPIPKSDKIDTFRNSDKLVLIKTRYFIISGTLSDRNRLLNFVDSFASRNYDDSVKKYPQYEMFFYKESDETNLRNIQENPRKLDDAYAQQHDLILIYSWLGGDPPIRDEFEDGGRINEKGKLTIKDVYHLPSPTRLKSSNVGGKK
jgi:hypothetical protein